MSVLAKSAHLIGLGLWVGVLAVVLVMSAGTSSRRSALSAMSRTAVAGAVIASISGLVLASRLVVSITALSATSYGVLLAGKLALITVAAGLGLVVHRRWRAGWSHGEIGLLAVAVLLGSAMATATPAIDRSFTDDAPAVASVDPAVEADDLLLQVRAIPARPGTNTLELRIAETRRPSPGAISAVDVELDGRTFGAGLNDRGVGFIEDVTLPSGATTIRVATNRDGAPDTSANLVVRTEALAYVYPTWISSKRIEQPLLVTALVVSLMAIAFAAAVRRRRAHAGMTVRRAVDRRPVEANSGTT